MNKGEALDLLEIDAPERGHHLQQVYDLLTGLLAMSEEAAGDLFEIEMHVHADSEEWVWLDDLEVASLVIFAEDQLDCEFADTQHASTGSEKAHEASSCTVGQMVEAIERHYCELEGNGQGLRKAA